MYEVVFYLERAGTVIAVDKGGYWLESDGEGGRQRVYDAVGAVFERPNSPVASTSVSSRYLRECRRIGERTARKRHPALFDYLDLDLAS